jgi:L-ribulose-5-phosphate 3-epimerase
MKNLFTLSLRYLAILTLALSIVQCTTKTETGNVTDSNKKELKISLAQWSIHRALEAGELKAVDFPAIAKNKYGITAVEYVNQFYVDHATDEAFWKMMRAKTDSLGVKNLLIMCDNEGDLGNPNEAERNKAVENHYKWVDAASILGCHSIRINAFGTGTREEVQAAMVDALKKLCTYAAQKNINVVIENHGLYSSDGKWITEVMQKVNTANCGTLPDFGNWCTAVQWGSTEKSKNCTEAYDRYLGVTETLPYAKGVSAKSYEFDAQGEETVIDYTRMLQLVKDSGFDGYVGIEYEGAPLSEHEGILATKALLEKAWGRVK